MQAGHGGPFGSGSIAVTSDSEGIVKRAAKFGSFAPATQTDLHAVADLIRFPTLAMARGRTRGMAQSGSASALGAEGRGFESLCPDHPKKGGTVGPVSYIIAALPTTVAEPSTAWQRYDRRYK
jgi:hypothetical protein